MTAETRRALKLARDAAVRAGLPHCERCADLIVQQDDGARRRHDSHYCSRRCQQAARKAAQLTLNLAA